VAAGTISLVLFFFICRRLRMSLAASNLATFLLAFENMTFVQASVAMLDVYYYTFLLAAFLLYLSRRYVFSGAAVALSTLAKLSGAFALPVIGLHWLFARGRRSRRAVLIAVLAVAAFLALLPLCDFIITRHFVNPFDRIGEMLRLTRSMTFATAHHYALSRPWEWLVNYWPIAYFYTPHYYGGVSPTVWVLILPSVIYMTYRAFKGNRAALFGVAWFLGTYALWIPLSIITDRISFVYYFYPTVGAICLGIGLGLGEVLERYRKTGPSRLNRSLVGLVIVFLAVHLVLFLLMSPVTNVISWTSLPW
jgi:dolichyl-phosphate-mannose-protein mannosyltransferase